MYDFYCFEFVRCALWPTMWSILMSVPCEPEKKCIQLLLDKVACTHQLYPVDWWCFWIQLFLLIFCLLDSFLRGVDVPNYDSGFNYFSMKILLDALILSPYHQGLLYLLEEFSLYYCIMPWLIPDNFSCIKIWSVWSNITNLTSFSSC